MPQPHFLQPKKIIRRSTEPHPQFQNSAFADPYSGCEMGCVYCYGVREEILDDGEGPSPFHVGIKTNCAFSLQRELLGVPAGQVVSDYSKPSPLPLCIGFSTDPYQACEEKYQLTQRCLEILSAARCPVHIMTKSELILRDREILGKMSERGLAAVSVSVFTLDEKFSRLVEPRAPSPKKRLDLIESLRGSNIECGAMLMPIFPFITDGEEELSKLFSALRAHGASYCVPSLLSLSRESVRKRIGAFLREHLPEVLERYRNLYDFNGQPSEAYVERVQELLEGLSKHNLSLALPVQDPSGRLSLLTKDVL